MWPAWFFPPWPSKVVGFFRPRKITQKSEEKKTPEPLKAHMPRIGSFFTLSYRVSSHAQPPNASRMGGVSQNIWGENLRAQSGVRNYININTKSIHQRHIFRREFSLNWHRGHKSDLSVSIWNVRLSLICLIFFRENFWRRKKGF